MRQYLQPDPLTLTRPGWKDPIYSYAGNNPLSIIDLMGLACVGPGWQSMGLAESWAHLNGVPHANVMQFELTCPTCGKGTNVHLDYGTFTGMFDFSSFGGDAPGRVVDQGGSGSDYWLLVEVRTSLVLLVPSPNIKACYDCGNK